MYLYYIKEENQGLNLAYQCIGEIIPSRDFRLPENQ